MRLMNKVLTIILLIATFTTNLVFAENYTIKNAFEFINPHVYDETNGVFDTSGSRNANVGFMKESNGKVSGFEDYISYVIKGLSFTYKNVYFNESPTTISVYCGYGNFEPYVGKPINVYVDGQLLTTVVTEKRTDNKVEWDTATALVADVAGKISAGTTHDITITFVKGETNYFGFKFSAENAFSYFDPHYYDETNGVYDTTGAMNADVGFSKESDGQIKGLENNIGYIKAGLSFTYKNVYFPKAPATLNLYCGYANFGTYIGRTINVYADDQLLATLKTEQRPAYEVDWKIPTALVADVTGKIDAGTIHDIKIVFSSGGQNFFGFKFSMYEDVFDSGTMNSGEYISKDDLYFSTSPLYIEMTAQVIAGTVGNVEVYSDTMQSTPIATFEIDSLTNVTEKYTAPIVKQITGYHDIYIKFNTGGITVENISFLSSLSTKNAYNKIQADNADVLSSDNCMLQNSTIVGKSNGFVGYKNCKFNKAPWYVKADVSTESGSTAILQVRVDSIDGDIIAEINATSDDGGAKEYIVRLNEYYYGLHDVYFVWQGDAVLHSFNFLRAEDYPNIHNGYNWSELLLNINYNKSKVANFNKLGRYKTKGLSQISFISKGDIICFENCSFAQPPEKAMISVGGTVAATYDIELRLDNPDGKLIAAYKDKFKFNSTSYGESIYTDVLTDITGTHDIYLCFKSDVVNLFGLQFFNDNVIDLKKSSVSEYDYFWENNGVKYYAYNGINAGKKPQKYVSFTPVDTIATTGRFTLTLNSTGGTTLIDGRTSKSKFVGNMVVRDNFVNLCTLFITDSAGTYNYTMRFSDTNLSYENANNLVTVFTDAANSGKVVVCAYKNNCISSIKTCNFNLTKKGYFDVNLDDEFLSGADTLKVFALKDMVNIIPLYEFGVYELPKGEKL